MSKRPYTIRGTERFATSQSQGSEYTPNGASRPSSGMTRIPCQPANGAGVGAAALAAAPTAAMTTQEQIRTTTRNDDANDGMFMANDCTIAADGLQPARGDGRWSVACGSRMAAKP